MDDDLGLRPDITKRIRAVLRGVEGAPPCRCTHRLARHDRDMACTEPDCDCAEYGSRL